MNEQDHDTMPAPVAPPRRAYTAPRLVVHGNVQALTQDLSSIDGTSGVDTP